MEVVMEKYWQTFSKAILDSWPFHKPVNKKLVKDYYNIVQQPMDLESITKNIKSHKYHNRDDFINDVDLIYQNSITYNGPDHSLTKKAKEIVDMCKVLIAEYDEHLQQLERNIQAAQEAALDAAETDSVVTGTSLGPADHDEGSLMGLDENHSLADGESESRPAQRMIKSYGKDGEEMYVDIEGEDESEVNYPSQSMQNVDVEDESNVLVEDLQITPENSEASDNEGSDNDFLSKLSEEGSDSEPDTKQESEAGSNQVYVTAGYQQQYEASTEETAYYQAANGADVDDSMMVDENYDPSAFLLQGNVGFQQGTAAIAGAASHRNGNDADINNDLVVSESEDEGGSGVRSVRIPNAEIHDEVGDDDEQLWF